MGYLIKHEREYTILKPKAPVLAKDETANPVDVEILKTEVKEFVARKSKYAQNKDAVYMVIWGQCSKPMQDKIKAVKSFNVIDDSKDVLLLLKAIKGISHKYESEKYTPSSILKAKLALLLFRQSHHQSVSEYHTKFKQIHEVLIHYNGRIGDDKALIDVELKRQNIDPEFASITETKIATKAAQERFAAYLFIHNSDNTRFKHLQTNLTNQYALGHDQYPKDLGSAYSALLNYTESSMRRKPTNPNGNRGNDKPEEKKEDEEVNEVAFVHKEMNKADESKTKQVVNQYTKTSTVDKSKGPSSDTNEHVSFLLEAADNPDLDYDYSDFSYVHYEALFTESPSFLHKNIILLDNQSSAHIMYNKEYLKDINQVPPGKEMVCLSNGGSQTSAYKGYSSFIQDKVWYNSEAIANILSMSLLRKNGIKMEYDWEKDTFTIILPSSGRRMMFFSKQLPNSKGCLYIHDTTWTASPLFKPALTKPQEKSSSFTLVPTVADNKKMFHAKDVKKAEAA